MDETTVVETRKLTKRYGPKITAVDELDLTVHRGEVYGFLGPNGAGKTTTLRMLLGLIKPTSGEARVLGERPGAPSGLRRVGALVESPAFYPYLSGYDNLKGMVRYSGRQVSRERLGEVLEQVGLAGRAKDKFKKYSLGMKQRLGVAAALLKDPELLILDEPTNGLDPKGMAEMRELISVLGRGERTVLLSSHLMNEVEQTCDRVAVIHKGRLMAEGTVSELRGGVALLIKAEPLERAAQVVKRIAGTESVEVKDGAIRVPVDPNKAPEIARELVTSGIDLKELRPAERSLEQVFFQLTGEQEPKVEAGG